MTKLVSREKEFGILGVIKKAAEGPGLVDKAYTIRRSLLARAEY
jgi:hypothetical protein